MPTRLPRFTRSTGGRTSIRGLNRIIESVEAVANMTVTGDATLRKVGGSYRLDVRRTKPSRRVSSSIAVFILDELFGDFLKCHTPESTTDVVLVAKPFLLRNSVKERNGIDYDYDPDNTGDPSTTRRKATIKDNGMSQIEVVIPAYVVANPDADPPIPGDRIVAARFPKSSIDPDGTGDGLDTVEWMELPSNRQWMRKRIQNAG